MTTSVLTLPPVSLYIHIPWCVRKCPYCDFNSHQQPGQLPESGYIDCLLEDLAADRHLLQGRKLHSIFIGGGTPSLFAADSYKRLLDGIGSLASLPADTEITLEANPGTFEQEKFTDFRQAGINRLSIGIQSFESAHLQRLGRIHDGDESVQATAIAHDAGFDNFNLDLMFALPQQQVEEALSDIETAIGCSPRHISWYQLTIEPNTEFHRYPPALPDDELTYQIQTQGGQLLREAGYSQYETSAWTKPGHESRHNLNYWHFGDYLGIGAGAHSKITLPLEGRIVRYQKTRMPDHYLDPFRPYTAQSRTVEAGELTLEFMMNALRLTSGSDLNQFQSGTGLDPEPVRKILQKLSEQELLIVEGDSFRPSARGALFLNDLLMHFF